MYISTIRCCCSLDISRINKKVKKMPEKPAYKNINNSFLSHNIFLLSAKKTHFFLFTFHKKVFCFHRQKFPIFIEKYFRK